MALELAATGPSDRDALVEFLLQVYQLPSSAPFVQPRLADWKYYEPRPDWEGSRSYVCRQNGRIVAHGCVVPVVFRFAERTVTSLRLIDWAGTRGAPGAGVFLLKKLAERRDTVIAVGGSTDTRRVLPAIGFRLQGESAIYVRVVRAWRQFRSDPFRRGWKAPLRLCRNLLWSCAVLPEAPPGWSAHRIPRFDSSIEPVLVAGGGTSPTPERSVEMLNYMLRCPGAAFTAHEARRDERLRGYFLLSRAGGQTRVAEIRPDSAVPDDWEAMHVLAARCAAEDPETCEIVAVASRAVERISLEKAGYRFRRTEPIYVYDPKGLLREEPELPVNLLEGDEAYLHNPAYPYET